jgi:hypothetical protein
VARVVDLVEDDEAVRSKPGQGAGRGGIGDLLVGRDQAVDVAGEAVAGRPLRIELESEPDRGATAIIRIPVRPKKDLINGGDDTAMEAGSPVTQAGDIVQDA